MKKATISAALFVTFLVVVLAGHRRVERDVDRATVSSAPSSPAAPAEQHHRGFLYGRITTDDGGTHVGRLRFGRHEEAFWGDYFNGFKGENPWAAQTGRAELTQKRPAFTLFGLEFPLGARPVDLGRPFMARFGDIVRIEARGREVRVTLKSGSVFDLDRMAASDFDDGVRVWDGTRGVVDLASWAGGIGPPAHVRIRTIELIPTGGLGAVPGRLHGTVRTGHGDLTGFIQWDRQACVTSDELAGHTAQGPLSVPFETIRSIARRSGDSSLVTLRDGRDIALSGSRAAGEGNRGIYVDDLRYGRVLVSWDAFERVDFSAAGSGPAYTDFPPGSTLAGTVSTLGGRRLTGRLVFDLDESETTETLDAPSRGVDYTLPFGLVASIVPARGDEGGARRARVTLHGGEELRLDRAGDLGDGNAGMLIFLEGRERAEYVPWTEVQRIEFNRPPLMYPPLRGQ